MATVKRTVPKCCHNCEHLSKFVLKKGKYCDINKTTIEMEYYNVCDDFKSKFISTEDLV